MERLCTRILITRCVGYTNSLHINYLNLINIYWNIL